MLDEYSKMDVEINVWLGRAPYISRCFPVGLTASGMLDRVDQKFPSHHYILALKTHHSPSLTLSAFHPEIRSQPL